MLEDVGGCLGGQYVVDDERSVPRQEVSPLMQLFNLGVVVLVLALFLLFLFLEHIGLNKLVEHCCHGLAGTVSQRCQSIHPCVDKAQNEYFFVEGEISL